jgi:hypothetical protein
MHSYGLDALDGGRPLLDEHPVPAVWAPDSAIFLIKLHYMLAVGALIYH